MSEILTGIFVLGIVALIVNSFKAYNELKENTNVN